MGFALCMLIVGGLTNYLLKDRTGPLRTLLVCMAGLAVGLAAATAIGTYRVGQPAIMLPALLGASLGVLGVFVATLRERHRLKQADVKKSPSDLRSRQ